MAVYADYEFYQETYLGTAIAEADFPRLAQDASAEIDRQTFDQAASVIAESADADAIERIGLATCAVAEVLHSLVQSGGVVQSETVGRHSVTYAKPLSEAARLHRAARRYLAGTGLMYRGVAPC